MLPSDLKLRMLSRSINVSTILKGFRPSNNFRKYIESEISIPVSLVTLEDDDGLTRKFLCCYVDTRTRVYDCDELMAVKVPPQFSRVKELLGTHGNLKRVFTPKGVIFSYDVNGKTRVKEDCFIAAV